MRLAVATINNLHEWFSILIYAISQFFSASLAHSSPHSPRRHCNVFVTALRKLQDMLMLMLMFTFIYLLPRVPTT
jgi:ABC-type arginine transport system permease subunit